MADDPEDPCLSSLFEASGRWRPEHDLGHLNAHATERILEQTASVAEGLLPRCLVLVGVPGSGKSHELQRIRGRAREVAVPLVIRHYARPAGIFRSLFRQSMWALLQTTSPSSGDLLLEVAEGVIAAIQSSPDHIPSLQDILQGERTQPMTAAQRRRDHLEACIEYFEEVVASKVGRHTDVPLYSVDALRTILLYALPEPEIRSSARRWLMGQDLEQRDLVTLGLQRCMDDEVTAREGLSLLGLMGVLTHPIILGLDQTEQFEDSPEETGLEAMNRVFTHLQDSLGFSVVLTCRTGLWASEYSRELLTDLLDRFTGAGQELVELRCPDSEEAVELVHRRLGGKLHPFTKAGLEQTLTSQGKTPRAVLRSCEGALRSWRRAGSRGRIHLPPEPKAVSMPGHARSPTTQPAYEQILEATPVPRHLDAQRTAAGMAHLVACRERFGSIAPPHHPPPGTASPFSLVVPTDDGRVGFVFDDVTRGSAFARRAAEILEALSAGALRHLFYWRDEEPPRSWRIGREHWKRLQDRNDVTIHHPRPETLRRLHAFQVAASDPRPACLDSHPGAGVQLPEALVECPEIQAILQHLGQVAAAGAYSSTCPGTDPRLEPIRAAVLRVISDHKVLGRDRLLQLVNEVQGRPVKPRLFHRVLARLEDEGLLWRLGPGQETHVVSRR